ncbi:MAG: winged helix-turn-helix domain-containing protein, partial [Psychrosphaera sp.]|nr:winged helix-turn-helix domain-containing protein [Psychrosphaera sp.]
MSKTEKALSEFSVGKYHIDMGRSQITVKDEPLTMEPKALQVLLVLAENQGKVVSHQTLSQRVWPNVQVAPNVLQRCIGHLRKAFGDDVKKQHVIATHPRVGYSLVAEVDWHVSSPAPSPATTSTSTAATKNNRLSITALSALTLVLMVSLLWVLFYPKALELPLNQISSLTTSDRREFAPAFSPDGRYIAFQRTIKGCHNELWAIDLTDNTHYRLTKTPGIYGKPSWSPDSQQLAFSSVTRCGSLRELTGCKDIQAISFALAKTTPQSTHQLLGCDQQDYDNVVWLNESKLAFTAFEDNRHQLMTLSLG